MLSGMAFSVVCSGGVADTLPPFNPFGTQNPPVQNPAPANPQVQAALTGFWRGVDNMNQEIVFFFSPQGTGYLIQNNTRMEFSYTIAGNMMTVSDSVSSESIYLSLSILAYIFIALPPSS